MIQKEIKSQITEALFWDINFSKIDFTKQKSFIIPRIMDRGTKKDVKLIWDFYGEEIIKETLLNARFLEDKTICFFANIFSIQPDDFRAFRIKQNQTLNWNL